MKRPHTYETTGLQQRIHQSQPNRWTFFLRLFFLFIFCLPVSCNCFLVLRTFSFRVSVSLFVGAHLAANDTHTHTRIHTFIYPTVYRMLFRRGASLLYPSYVARLTGINISFENEYIHCMSIESPLF